MFAEALELQKVIARCECLLCRAPKVNSQNPPKLNHGDSHGVRTCGLNRHRKLAGEQSRKGGQRHRRELGQHREDRVTERAGPGRPDRPAKEVCKGEADTCARKLNGTIFSVVEEVKQQSFSSSVVVSGAAFIAISLHGSNHCLCLLTHL